MAGGEPRRRTDGTGTANGPDERPLDRQAIETARTLVEAYHLQDERERYLEQTEPDRAIAVGTSARQRMGEVWAAEFPTVPEERARAGGDRFARALFVQDEIENWETLRDDADALESAFLHGAPDEEPDSVESDPRWSAVESQLRDACHQVGIETRYAELQAEFWRLHGVGDPDWQEVAHRAHTVKLRAMVEDAERMEKRLGDRFVRGVQLHDEWDEGPTAGLSETVQHVAAYYRELFELRGSRSV